MRSASPPTIHKIGGANMTRGSPALNTMSLADQRVLRVIRKWLNAHVPNWFLLVDTQGKGPRHRVMPMDGQVRGALLQVIQDRTSRRVFDYAHTGVSASTLRSGFRKACERAGIPFGQDVEGGLIWHDLRRTFATKLRGRQVHEYDISDLLGHTILGVTGTHARSTPEALEEQLHTQSLRDTRNLWPNCGRNIRQVG